MAVTRSFFSFTTTDSLVCAKAVPLRVIIPSMSPICKFFFITLLFWSKEEERIRPHNSTMQRELRCLHRVDISLQKKAKFIVGC